jgi:hypothetical protein
MSYAPQVIADSTGQWTGNGLRFATEQEAQSYVRDLEFRWTAVRDTRVVVSEAPPTHAWVNDQLAPLRNPPCPNNANP